MALELLARDALHGPLAFGPESRTRLMTAIRGQKPCGDAEHGHAVLIDWLSAQSSPVASRLLVEIGTTRERVPGQGSTEKLAHFCAAHDIEFITVDMDPRNTARAQRMFRRLGLSFQAITAKGEEWLAAFPGKIDYVFLDAYDFDHGKHSQQRQSRYEQFLGAPIGDDACHQMHLDCAIILAQKISKDGVICIDDTWMDEKGKWTAKGTKAVPFLLENGFQIFEARNRSLLLARL
jgi:hypothetical protein